MVTGERVARVTGRDMEEIRHKAARLLGVAANTLELEVQGVRKSGLFGLGAPELVVLARIPELDEAQVSVQDEDGAVVTTDGAVESPPDVDMESGQEGTWVVWCEAGDCLFRTNTRNISVEEVEEIVRGWPFDEYFGDGLRAAVQQVNDANVMIGRIHPPPELTADTRFFLNIPADGMSVWVIPGHDPFNDTVSAVEILAAMEQKGVVFGIDHGALQAFDGRRLTRPLLVARGFEGAPSRDSAVEYLFPEEDPDVVLRPVIREDGSVDYRDLIRLHTVPAGTLLGHYLPASAGESRRDVFGREVASKPGKEIPPQRFAGPNVALATNGLDFVATKPGRPIREGARIEVMEVYAIKGDVDFSTGNVDFRGEVYVGGNVKPGFTVRATGSVQVGGLVDSANIEAGKDILIQGGISGHGECRISCGGDLSARFIDSAEVVAQRDVMVASTIVRSSVNAGRKVMVLGRGSIVGGKVKAVMSITCSTVGSVAGVPTSLELDWLSTIKPGMEHEAARYQTASILIRGDAFPGVMVSINGAKFPIREKMRGVQFGGSDRGIALSQVK